ncbi:hypothetical protein IAR55_004438 [Kwoniella newhampshirensis]|uniref:MARVEL domain-containing protein n=1 Tax=Kwoniella newhampshirensis TaxID=1651941 RepID=A0AAW0Z0K5_9TREE
MASRLPPPTGPPPRYTAVVAKVYPYTLRPVVIVTSIIGFIYGLALGVESVRDFSSRNEIPKERIYDIISAIFYFAVAVIEFYAVVVATLQSLSLARLLFFFAPAGILLNIGCQVIGIIVHYALKSDLIAYCVTDEMDGTFDSLTQSQAESACNSAWRRGTWSVFAWLILTGIISVLFASILLAYYRQLIDPASVRQRVPPQTHNQAFQMQPGYYPPPLANDQQQSWMVPPYPGPPANGPPPPASGFEKSDYQPDVEWAQAEYAPPPGPPPSQGGSWGTSGPAPNRAEDEAWERARTEGVTAHLTGQGPGPITSRRDEERGFVVDNEEEEEAWERARNAGVTAHLTGGPRSREGAI